jgi:ATP phosphoribosyltransferase regulatory subunit
VTPIPPATLAAIRAPFEAFGGAWTDAPMLQPLSLLLDLAGEAVRARLYVVSGGVEDEALRPDFTIPVTRAHIASGAAEGRYLYEGKAFRAPESAVDGAAHENETEFPQIGVEVFGAAHDPGAEDAAVAALAWTAAKAGGRGDLTLELGDVGLFRAFLAALKLPETTAQRLIRAFATPRILRAELHRAQAPADEGAGQGGRLARLLADLPEHEAAEVLEALWRLAGIQPVGGRTPAEIAHRLALRAEAAQAPPLTAAEAALIERFLALSDHPRAVIEGAEGLAAEGGGDLTAVSVAWARRLEALVKAGAPESAMRLTTAFVRPFGYYDGVLFEVRSAALGPEAPVAAGGRYDGLPARLGGVAGAVGCMVRPDRAYAGAVR